MIIEIFSERWEFDLYGYGDVASDKAYAETAFVLSGKMWEWIKANGIQNKGKNIWVYEKGDRVFAGVEIDNGSGRSVDLEKLSIRLEKYARYTHIGPYSGIHQAGKQMSVELSSRGYEVTNPYIEIYGHWIPDEQHLETDLIMCLK